MERTEYWREYATTVAPFLGFIAAAWALPLGMESVAAGLAYGSLGGYLASLTAFGSGYVLARRAWDGRVDRRFALAFGVLVLVSVYVLTSLHTPPNVFQRIGRW